jgi:superfamily I DNA/RNA helicase
MLSSTSGSRKFTGASFNSFWSTNTRTRTRSRLTSSTLLARDHRNVMVVGDDAQSIYSWRGANFQNILEFPKRYPDAQVFKIELNYRSVPEILEWRTRRSPQTFKQFGNI